ncbi:MAG: GIN domain-containing protein, partial [Pirellulaceae bacterium]
SLTETRDLDSFDKVSLEEFGTIHVSFGDTQTVTVTTDDNLVSLVETTVQDGELKVRPIKALNPSVDLVIHVTVPRLTSAELAGAARLNIIDIDGESLDIELAGACGVDATGQVDKLSVELAGACRARLRNLKTRHAVVEIAGTGSAVVFASESIDAEAAGFASITCHGNPDDVKKEAAGISRVTIVDS